MNDPKDIQGPDKGDHYASKSCNHANIKDLLTRKTQIKRHPEKSSLDNLQVSTRFHRSGPIKQTLALYEHSQAVYPCRVARRNRLSPFDRPGDNSLDTDSFSAIDLMC